MEFGLLFANTMAFAGAEGAALLGRAAEDAGFDSVWTVEHVVYPDDYASRYPYDPSGRMAMSARTPLPDPLVWLTWVAAHTRRLRLATGILILPQRNPVVLAKEVATLDALSGGRVELGVGVGWLREEFDALGVPFEHRGARTDEYVEVLRALWDGDHAQHSGRFVEFAGVSSNPKPVEREGLGRRVPIHIGGHSPAAARRAGRLGDGFFPGEGRLGELLVEMRTSAEDAGRDPDAIEVTAVHAGVLGDDPLAAVEKMADRGVHRLGVPAWAFALEPDPAEAIAAFAERVIVPSRG
jgi:probable F420-dependent oxidoreductase